MNENIDDLIIPIIGVIIIITIVWLIFSSRERSCEEKGWYTTWRMKSICVKDWLIINDR